MYVQCNAYLRKNSTNMSLSTSTKTKTNQYDCTNAYCANRFLQQLVGLGQVIYLLPYGLVIPDEY